MCVEGGREKVIKLVQVRVNMSKYEEERHTLLTKNIYTHKRTMC